MKYYLIAEVNVTNPTWVPEYLGKVNGIVGNFGGQYLARTGQYAMLEDDASPHHGSSKGHDRFWHEGLR